LVVLKEPVNLKNGFLKVTTASPFAVKVIFTQVAKNSKIEREEQGRTFISKHLILPSDKMHCSLVLSTSYFITAPQTGLMRTQIP